MANLPRKSQYENNMAYKKYNNYKNIKTIKNKSVYRSVCVVHCLLVNCMLLMFVIDVWMVLMNLNVVYVFLYTTRPIENIVTLDITWYNMT